MQDADWKKTKEIFHQTLDLPINERTRFLASQDDFVRSEVVRLLASHEKLDDFIAEPFSVEIGVNVNSYLGKTIGSYKILEIIGTGGMGQVFLAEKEGLDKKFALKIIKRGMDTETVLKKFFRERQILSRLQHPNIASILDAGSTENDLPYFVMEYIDGEPITKFCDSHQLDATERLGIFQKVCNAVNYAHQNLIIHRDVKPPNILVMADGTPKLLDFGIAKLLNIEESENNTNATQARMFTPEYASPEQKNGLPITTATDIYSLGVVLHELLNGVRPDSNWRDIETRKKSETMTNSQITGTRNRSFFYQTSPDINNIILKALRKEPERRYQTVQEFSEDIRRFLVGLPVTATADSTYYRFSKFVSRNKIGTLIGILILSVSGIAVWQGIDAMREREKAERRFEQVRQLANTVLFEYHDGISKLPGSTSMREKMVKDSLGFLDNLSTESIENIELQRDIVKAYKKIGDIQGASDTGNLGKTKNALESYQKALERQENIVSLNAKNFEDQRLLGDLQIDIGLQQRSLGDFQATESIYQKALTTFSNLPNDSKKQSSLAKTYWNIASLETAQNNLNESIENYEKALEIYQQLAVAEPTNNLHLQNIALTNKNIGSVLQLRGENEKALQHFNKSLMIDLENAKNNPNDVSALLDLSFTYGTIASALRDAKKFQEAIENHQKATEIREKVFNADSKNAFAENALARGFQEFGRTYLEQQKYVEAEQLLSKSQKLYQQMTDTDPENSVKKKNLAENLSLLGFANGLNLRIIKADEFYENSLIIYSDLLKQNKLSTFDQKRFARAYLGFGEVLLKNKQTVKAIENLNKAQELLENEKVRVDANEEINKLKELIDLSKK